MVEGALGCPRIRGSSAEVIQIHVSDEFGEELMKVGTDWILRPVQWEEPRNLENDSLVVFNVTRVEDPFEPKKKRAKKHKGYEIPQELSSFGDPIAHGHEAAAGSRESPTTGDVSEPSAPRFPEEVAEDYEELESLGLLPSDVVNDLRDSVVSGRNLPPPELGSEGLGPDDGAVDLFYPTDDGDEDNDPVDIPDEELDQDKLHRSKSQSPPA